MEELKLLIGMVADLPTMAIWVLLFFFIYKVTIIGSVFGLIKLFIVKLHSYLVTPKHEIKEIDVYGVLHGEIITGELNDLLMQIMRLKGVKSFSNNYIRADDVAWLKEAIDEKLEKPTEAPKD